MIYVDNFRAPTVVAGLRARWSHLTADTPAELQDFASRLGLRPEWFQARCKFGPCPIRDDVCRHFHYDVTDSKRMLAIHKGAVQVSVRELGYVVAERSAYYRGEET